MKIRLEDMTWPEVEGVLKKPHVMILPVGSIEQHGPHLPLSVDFRCAVYIAEQAATRVTEKGEIHTLVAPAVHYAETSIFSSFPGTIGLSIDTTSRVIEDITRGFITQGFKNILIINGHGPNTAPIAIALRKVDIDFPSAGLYALNWWDMGSDVIRSIRHSEAMGHACELETSVSLVIQPENVHMDKAVRYLPRLSLSSKWVSADFYGPKKLFYHSRKRYPEPKMGTAFGAMGDPTVATRESGEKFLAAIIADIVELITEIVKSGVKEP
jgi:creatinine amidohydrolase